MQFLCALSEGNPSSENNNLQVVGHGGASDALTRPSGSAKVYPLHYFDTHSKLIAHGPIFYIHRDTHRRCYTSFVNIRRETTTSTNPIQTIISANKKPSTPAKLVVAIPFAPFVPVEVEVELGEDDVGVAVALAQVMLDGTVKLLAKVKSAHRTEKVNSI